MNWTEYKSNWKQLKGKAKERWGTLIKNDQLIVDGQCEQIKAKYQAGIQREKIVPAKAPDKLISPVE